MREQKDSLDTDEEENPDNQELKTPRCTSNEDDELMFIMRKYDLENLNEMQLRIMKNFSKI